jgi:hypothetical protein
MVEVEEARTRAHCTNAYVDVDAASPETRSSYCLSCEAPAYGASDSTTNSGVLFPWSPPTTVEACRLKAALGEACHCGRTGLAVSCPSSCLGWLAAAVPSAEDHLCLRSSVAGSPRNETHRDCSSDR